MVHVDLSQYGGVTLVEWSGFSKTRLWRLRGGAWKIILQVKA
jgi:hypothetical protein